MVVVSSALLRWLSITPSKSLSSVCVFDEVIEESCVSRPSVPFLFTLLRHNRTDCWIIVKNNVYNVTSYLKEHPGGIGAIVMNGGRDCTEDFEVSKLIVLLCIYVTRAYISRVISFPFQAIHSTKAWDMLAQFQVGVLDTAGASSSTSTSTSNGGGAEVIDTTGPALTGRGAPVNCRLIFKEYEANDVLRLRFALPYPEQSLGLAVGLHLGLRAKINGRTVMRSYTPVSDPEDKGMFELLVKVSKQASQSLPSICSLVCMWTHPSLFSLSPSSIIGLSRQPTPQVPRRWSHVSIPRSYGHWLLHRSRGSLGMFDLRRTWLPQSSQPKDRCRAFCRGSRWYWYYPYHSSAQCHHQKS